MGLKPESISTPTHPIPDPLIVEASSLTPDPSATTRDHVARATGIVALGNITSRILGLVREIILSHLFGASIQTDAFKAAIIVPRGLYDLLIGGHVNSALVPVLSEYATNKDRKDLWELVNLLLGLVTIILVGLILVLELFAPQVLKLVAGDAHPETLAEGTKLLRITAPALLFLSLFAVLSGLLYALKRFTMPAFAASVFNGTIVITTILLADSIGITAAAVGWFIGAVAQLVIQFPQLRDARFYPRFKGMLTHPGVRTIGVLYVPVLFSLGLDVLINRPFSYNLASRAGTANITYMDWATTLIQFPHGLVATAISVAVLPTLSQQASLATQHSYNDFKDTLGLGLRLSTVLILPATIGLFVLASPVIALIFEHGEFMARDTQIMAKAVRLYLIGLPFAAIDLLLVFAFYARKDTLTPAIIGVVSLLAYIATALLLESRYGFFSLMIADSVKHGVHSGISGYLLWKRVGGFRGQHFLATTLKAGSVALIMGGVAYLTLQAMESVIPASMPIAELLYVIGAGGIGLITYGVLGRMAGIQEIGWMLGVLRRRLRR